MGSIHNKPAGRDDDLWMVTRAALDAATLTRSPVGRVIAVMVNFNGRRFLEASIGSALAALAVYDGDLLVVDNASTDGSGDYIRDRFPGVAVLSLAENTGGSGGFSSGMLAALECPQCEWIWLLDNDVIIEPGALEPLLNLLRMEPGSGAVGSQICLYDRPEIVQEVGGHVSPWLGALRQYGAGGRRFPEGFGAVTADYLAACSVMVRRSCLEEVGPFSDFFLYYDDVDWGLRARAAGWELRAEPASVVRHYFSGAKPLDPWREYYRKRNRAVFLARHPPRHLGLGALWIYLAYLNHLAFWYARLLDSRLGHVYRQALTDVVDGRLGRTSLFDVPGHDIDPNQTGNPALFLLWLRRPGECRALAELLGGRWPSAGYRFASGCVAAKMRSAVEPLNPVGSSPTPVQVFVTAGRAFIGSAGGVLRWWALSEDGRSAARGTRVVVVDDRVPLLALQSGNSVWQYLAGELRVLPRPYMTWFLSRVGLIVSAAYGVIRGSLQFPGVLRCVDRVRRDQPDR